ncbi:MAG: nucleotidyltransferase family protein [Acidimicrobiales bacterium]|jgi:CTP:molybdopterin cytidylyltransferase MocA
MSDVAVILAAGGGLRFNANDPEASPGAKLFALIKDKPVLDWAIAPVLEAQFDEVIVVGGAANLQEIVPEGVTLLQNPEWSRGLASSLHVALDWCEVHGYQRALVGLGDSPGLTSQAWTAVRDAPGGPIVFATYAGRRGHPVRLDADVWPLLPKDGEEGARALVRKRPDLASEVACLGEPADIDTPTDLQEWSRAWN